MHSSTSVALVLAAVLVVLTFTPIQSQPIQYGTVDFAIWNNSQCNIPWANADGPTNATYPYVDLSTNNCYNFNINDTSGGVIPMAYQLNCSQLTDINHQYFFQNIWFNQTTCTGIGFTMSHLGPINGCNPLVIKFNGTNQFNGSTIPTRYSQLLCTVTGLPSSSTGGGTPGIGSSSGISSSSGTNAAAATATFNIARVIVFALIAATAAAILL